MWLSANQPNHRRLTIMECIPITFITIGHNPRESSPQETNCRVNSRNRRSVQWSMFIITAKLPFYYAFTKNTSTWMVSEVFDLWCYINQAVLRGNDPKWDYWKLFQYGVEGRNTIMNRLENKQKTISIDCVHSFGSMAYRLLILSYQLSWMYYTLYYIIIIILVYLTIRLPNWMALLLNFKQ